MSRLPRILIGLCLAGIAFWLYSRLQLLQAAETPDPAQILMLFLGIIATAVAGGILLAFTLLPALGDLFAGMAYGSNEAIEPDAHRDATACIARGEFESAAAHYQKIIHDNPADSLAVIDLARLMADRLGNPARAAETIEHALQREWPPDDAGTLASRLADLYQERLLNPGQAEAIYRQIIETMPGTRHAANAAHRLQLLGS